MGRLGSGARIDPVERLKRLSPRLLLMAPLSQELEPPANQGPFWSAVLTSDVGRVKDKLLVKYDPRDLSRVFVLRPSGHFIEARYGDITLPAISLQEAQSALRALNAKGRREVDTRTIVKTAIAQRELVQAATRRTLELRGKIARTPRQKIVDDGLGSLRGIDSRTRITSVEGDA